MHQGIAHLIGVKSLVWKVKFTYKHSSNPGMTISMLKCYVTLVLFTLFTFPTYNAPLVFKTRPIVKTIKIYLPTNQHTSILISCNTVPLVHNLIIRYLYQRDALCTRAFELESNFNLMSG